MRIVVGLGLVLSTMVGLAACGGEKERAPAVSSGTGRGGSGNRGGSGSGTDGGQNGEGGQGGEAPADDPLAPIVVIVSPEALAHPNDGEVVIGADIEVL